MVISHSRRHIPPARLYLTLLCLLGLVSCAAPQPGPSPAPPLTSTLTPSTPAQAPTRAAAAPTDAPSREDRLEPETTVVTFAGFAYERPLFAPIIEAFNEQYAPLQVQYVTLPDYSANPEMQSDLLRYYAAAADTALAAGGNPALGRYFRDLQPLLEADPSFEEEDFWPAVLDGCFDSEGRMLGVPLNAGFYGIFYDEAAFDEAGLTHPAPGWTLDDLIRAAETLARKDGDRLRYGLAEQDRRIMSPMALPAPFIDAALLDAGGEPDAAALREAAGWYLDLAEREVIFTSPTTGDLQEAFDAWQGLFRSESPPAMWVADLGAYPPGENPVLSESDPFGSAALSRYGFAPFPVSADGSLQDTSPIWTQCAVVSAGAADPRAAWTWLSFLSRQPLIQDRTQTYELALLPARQSVAAASGYWERLPGKAVPVARFALEHPWPGPAYPETFEAAIAALDDALGGQVDFSTALQSRLAEAASTPQPTPGGELVVATPRPTPAPGTSVIDFFFNLSAGGASEIFTHIEAYQDEHPDTVIEVSTSWGASLPEDTLAYLAGQYDCFLWYPFFDPDLRPAGVLPLEALFQAEDEAFTQDFYPAVLDAFRAQGDLYGLPAFSQPQVMAYNPELLRRRGLEPPAPDWTFADFLELASAAASTEAGDESYGYATDPWDDLLLRGRGALGFDASQSPPAASFDSPEMLSALQWLADLRASHAVWFQEEDNYVQVQQAKAAGRVAFWATQAGIEAEIVSGLGGGLRFEPGVLPMPRLPESAGFDVSGAHQGFFISENAADPQACWDWLRYLTDQVDTFKGVPARRSLAESPDWEAQVGPERAEVYRRTLARVVYPPGQNLGSFGWPLMTWLAEAVQAALDGDDPQAALAESQVKAGQYLACIAEVEAAGMSTGERFDAANDCAREADPSGEWVE